MFMKSAENILNQIGNRKAIIFGAGKFGRELVAFLIDNNVSIIYIFDNDNRLAGLSIYGVPVSKPKKIEENTIYVVSVDDGYIRYQMRNQLLELGINEKDIICYYPHICIEYNAEASPGEYRQYIDDMYEETFGKSMNWDNPTTYNEKINWEKLNLYDDRRVMLADKSHAREWVSKKIGNQYLTRHLGVWDRPEDIDFDALPDSFVLKANNGSGRNILVKNKSELDITDTIARLKYWMSSNYMYSGFEMHYGKIKPRVIAEEYLEGLAETAYDYDVFCFHGEPRLIWCIKGSHRQGCVATFYDLNWIIQPFSYGYPLDIFPAPKPDQLEEMLGVTKVLCRDFDHVRIDWYIMSDGRILFSEMTFQTWAGLQRIVPEKWDWIIGSWI